MSLAYVKAAENISEPVNKDPPSREAQILTLRNTPEFDVLVIGGGATGCGCALDAVTRGKSGMDGRDTDKESFHLSSPVHTQSRPLCWQSRFCCIY